MTKEEAIEVVKSNWPPAHYTMLAEALTVLISHDDAIRREVRDHYEGILDRIAKMHETSNSEFAAYNMRKLARDSILGTEPARERKPE